MLKTDWPTIDNMKPKDAAAELKEPYVLSEEQRQFYEENGYLVIKEFIDSSVLHACKQRFTETCRIVRDKKKYTIPAVFVDPILRQKGLKGEDLVNKVQDILHDDIFSLYTENPRLLNVVSQFIGDNLTGINSMLINKPPGTGRHPPHQDSYYFPVAPVAMIIGTWTAIDHVTVDNGCLYVIPGSHKQNILYTHTDQPDANILFHGISEAKAPADRRVNILMNPGDTIFMHPLLVHGSGHNVSKNYRKAVSCHYANSECHYVDPLPEQRLMVQEVEALMRKFSIEDASVINLFRTFKTKVVKGVRLNL